MKYARYALITLYISLLPSVVLAVGSNFPDSYFAKDNPQLTPQERASIEIAKKWQQSSATGIKPVAGPDGTMGAFKQTTPKSHRIFFNTTADVALNQIRASQF